MIKPSKIVIVEITAMPEPTAFPFPTLGSFSNGPSFVVTFSAEQTESVGPKVDPETLFLCIDVPRAKWCRSVVEAVAFFKIDGLERRALAGLSPAEIAADWFTLAPKMRTKTKLLSMLSGEDENARLYSIIRDRNRMLNLADVRSCPHGKPWNECPQPECAI